MPMYHCIKCIGNERLQQNILHEDLILFYFDMAQGEQPGLGSL